MKNSIEYFDKKGKINTVEALTISKQRAMELGIKQIVLASAHGYTAREAAKIFSGTGTEIIAVTINAGYQLKECCMTENERQELEKAGVKVLTSQLSLGGGVSEAFLGEDSINAIVASCLKCFSAGMKVAVEVSIMAAEAGYVADDKEIISLGGSYEGADTAIVLVPSYARNFKDLRIREILCKPRIG